MLLNSKFNIATGLLLRLRREYRISLEAKIYYVVGYDAAVHDATLVAWKEKVQFDRIWPTSFVQALADKGVTYFAGVETKTTVHIQLVVVKAF